MPAKTLKLFILGGALVAGGLAALAVGDLVAFQANTPIKSADVNQNFTILRSAIQALEAPVGAARLADGAVTLPKLAVGGTLADGKVLKAQGGALVWGDDLVGSGGTTYSAGAGLALSSNTFSVALEGITSGMLADGAVTSAKLGSASVSSDKLADNAVTSGKLASDPAGLARVSGGVLSASGGNLTATGNLAVNGSLEIGYVNTFDIAGPLIGAGATFEQTATCPAGTRVLGAGYYNSTDSDLTITRFYPSAGTSWFVRGVNNSTTETRLYIRLTCARLG
ncbi:hypothetical protein [Calidithermus timidus]|uniref:hypothetical protein n=1 Tax=Calidithermus timidus TaxID=307124 RepID=UPI0003A54409|nr:hypothetical protein [Calidithermus timidus]